MKVFGSNDNSDLFEYDNKINNSYLKGKNISKYFQCQNQNENFYKYIKIIYTDTNWNNNWYILLCQLELFGLIL